VPLTEREIAALRPLIDELGVRRAVELYFHAVDAYDWDLLASLFTKDGMLQFSTSADHATALTGGPNIAAYIRERAGLFKVKTHRISHLKITVDNDRAECDTFAISNIVLLDGRMAVRGLRYQDFLLRGDDNTWRFTKRLHKAIWQHYAESVPPEVPKAESEKA